MKRTCEYTNVAALKHGRNSLGVDCPSPRWGEGSKGEVHRLIPCQQAASRLLNENTNLFGNAQLQIDLKAHAAVETVTKLQENSLPYKRVCAKSLLSER